MRCYSEIDYIKKTIEIERKRHTFSTELHHDIIIINRILLSWFLEQKRNTISIDKEYKVFSIYVPYFTDWVLLQNDYLPYNGEYFLN
jgi:hypothetical protein